MINDDDENVKTLELRRVLAGDFKWDIGEFIVIYQ